MSERTEVIALREKLRTRIIAFNIALQDFIEAVNNYMLAVDKLLQSLEAKAADRGATSVPTDRVTATETSEKS